MIFSRRRRRRPSQSQANQFSTRLLILGFLAFLAIGNECSISKSFAEAKNAQGSINRDYQSPSLKHFWHLRGGVLTKNQPESKIQPLPPPTPPPSGKAQIESKDESIEEETPKDDPRILMLIRLLFITYYGSLGSLLPYLPVYYHSLGHGGQVIGMLGAIKPFTTFLVAPFWGIVSDQTGSPFTVLYFTFLVSLVGQLLVAWKHNPTYIMVMVFITAFFNAPVKSLLDSMVMSHLNDRSRYGRLRLWGQLGFGIGSSGVGILLSRSKHRPYNPKAGGTLIEKLHNFWLSITGYKLLFLTYALMSVPSWLCIRAFHKLHDETEKEKEIAMAAKDPHSVKKEEQSSVGVWDGFNVLFHNSDALLFFFLVFVVGISSGIIENFAYVRMREVGGTGKDMGLSRLVSSVAGAPMFWFSGPLTELLGADRVIVLSLISYVIRFVIYALMRNPLQGLPAEAMRGVTFAAFWSTGTIYASRIAPPGMGATMVRRRNTL
jgi:MFS-type transporter involved in bile tolerance (Atg22 family)